MRLLKEIHNKNVKITGHVICFDGKEMTLKAT